jgi:fluoride exporter
MQTVLAIAAGGALGSVLRHFLNNAVGGAAGTNFPWGIFIINILGSFVMGVLISLFALVWEPPQAMRAFLTVGVLGGFTTFSTFSMDSVLLMERGALGASAFYVFGSVGFALIALYGGMVIVRMFSA